MTPTITAFAESPDGGQGQARDMRVRWALEEVSQRYDVRLVSFAEMKQPAHRAIQPFGQIPTYEAAGLALFESASIVLHIAQNRPGLLPADPDARARAITWMFAAVSTIEPPILDREAAEYLEGDKPWYAEHAAIIDDRVRGRLADLAARLGDAEWLDGTFSAGDLVMVGVLRRLKGSDLLAEHPNLEAYMARGEARAPFKRAYAAQYAVFAATETTGRQRIAEDA